MGTALYYLQNPIAPEPNKPPRFGVAVVIFADGKLLLEHRRDNFSWGLVSGDLKSTETFRQCALRKTLEETGIHLLDRQLKELKLFDDPSRIVSFLEGNIYRIVSLAYSVELFAVPEVTCGDESIELRFVDPMDLGNYEIAATHQDILEYFLSRQGCEYRLERKVWKK